LKSAVKAGLIARNVAGDADLPKVERRKIRPPEPKTYGALLDALVGVRLYVLLLVAGHSGMRRGELAGMKWADIDLTTGRWVLGLQRTSVGYEVIEKTAKTEAGEGRVVYLDESVLIELRTWRKQQIAERLAWGEAYVNGGYVFTRENGEPYHPDSITKQVTRLMRHAGLTGTLHTLRHFWASVLISSGHDIAAVSKAMGHASVGVTSDIYGWLYEKGRKAMAEAGAASIPRQSRTA
jgi:integrase